MRSRHRSTFQVMQELDPYIRFLQAYEPKNSPGCDNKWLIVREYAFTCFVTLTILALVSSILLNGWLCAEAGFDMGKTATNIGGAICTTQIAFMYLSLANNRKSIVHTLSHLQGTVNSRENQQSNWSYFKIISKYWKHFSLIFAPFLIIGNEKFQLTGCENSSKALDYYRRQEATHAFLTKVLFAVQMVYCICAYTISAALPISTVVFSWPKKEQWVLPYDM